jgi:hypothetical protein
MIELLGSRTAERLPPWVEEQEEEDEAASSVSTAELAECTCPDPCERDHDVD